MQDDSSKLKKTEAWNSISQQRVILKYEASKNSFHLLQSPCEEQVQNGRKKTSPIDIRSPPPHTPTHTYPIPKPMTSQVKRLQQEQMKKARLDQDRQREGAGEVGAPAMVDAAQPAGTICASDKSDRGRAHQAGPTGRK
ncbi:uncharacterized [Tachysurus ichikawai]